MLVARLSTGAGRPYTPDFTDDQRRHYIRLATAITEAVDSGQSVACLRLPKLFDLNLARRRKSSASPEEAAADLEMRRQLANLRVSLCARCPVLEECQDYSACGVEVYGFLAGAWRAG